MGAYILQVSWLKKRILSSKNGSHLDRLSKLDWSHYRFPDYRAFPLNPSDTRFDRLICDESLDEIASATWLILWRNIGVTRRCPRYRMFHDTLLWSV